MPELDAAHEVVDLADAEEVARAVLGQVRRRPVHDLVHAVLVGAERAADRDAVDGARGDRLGGLDPQVLVDAALDDAVDELALGPVGGVPVQAALQPAVRALGRARRVLARDVERRALVEDEREVGAQRGLDLHRRLGAHELLGAVEVGAEAHALLLDREDAPGAVRPHRRAPLDLVGDGAVAHREDLEAARVGDDRRAPAHELVQAAEALDELVAGIEEQVERVPQDHVVAEVRDLVREQALDGGLRRQRDERGRADGRRGRSSGRRRARGSPASRAVISNMRRVTSGARVSSTSPRPRGRRGPRSRRACSCSSSVSMPRKSERTPARWVSRAAVSFSRPAGVSFAYAPRASASQLTRSMKPSRSSRSTSRVSPLRLSRIDAARSHMRMRSLSASATYMSTS